MQPQARWFVSETTVDSTYRRINIIAALLPLDISAA